MNLKQYSIFLLDIVYIAEIYIKLFLSKRECTLFYPIAHYLCMLVQHIAVRCTECDTLATMFAKKKTAV